MGLWSAIGLSFALAVTVIAAGMGVSRAKRARRIRQLFDASSMP